MSNPTPTPTPKSDLKIERRGKYPGVKVHLGVPECQTLITAHDQLCVSGFVGAPSFLHELHVLAIRIAKHVHRAHKADPDLLSERTEEEIIAELEKEKLKSEAKLAAIAEGKDWTHADTTKTPGH